MIKKYILLIGLSLALLLTACQRNENQAPPEDNNNGLPAYSYDEIKAKEIRGIEIINDLEKTPVLRDEALFKEVAQMLQKTKSLEEGAPNDEVITKQGMVIYLNTEELENNEVVLYLSEENQRLTIGPTGKEYVIQSKELRDFITRDFESEFVIVEEEMIPAGAREWLQGFEVERGAYVYQDPDGTYIKILGGEKPTGGYSIEVSDYDGAAYPRRITIEEVNPEADAETTQALTYPSIIIKVKSDQVSQYQVVTSDGDDYEVEEKLVYAKLELPQEAAEISSPVQVKGKIIAFEGSFLVRILDSSDEIVHEAVVQADLGGPYWGSFDEEIGYSKPTSGAGNLELGEYSAKDGEYQLRFRIPVKFK